MTKEEQLRALREGNVTRHVTSNVTPPRNVTEKPVSNVTSVTGSTALTLEIDALDAEIKSLKRQLSERICPVCEARKQADKARVKKFRSKIRG